MNKMRGSTGVLDFAYLGERLRPIYPLDNDRKFAFIESKYYKRKRFLIYE